MQNKMPANCRQPDLEDLAERSRTPAPPALKINRQGFEVTPSLVSKTAANKKRDPGKRAASVNEAQSLTEK